jgi:hypothetical protein
MDKHELHRIASAVRKAAETLVDENDLGPAADMDLCGACGDVSMAFAEISGLIDGYEEGAFETCDECHIPHCWVRDHEGRIWDLTATQFDMEYDPIATFTKNSYRHHTELRGTEAVKSINHWGNIEWREKLKVAANKLLNANP